MKINIFKKNNQELLELPELPITDNSYPKEILNIHNEFDNAGEMLYQEALKIINNTKVINETKLNLLKEIGFVNCKEVKEKQSLIDKITANKETVNLIEEYKRKYPLNKFITKERIEQICSKYNLIYGNICDYTGFIPEKNLIEISNFKKKYSFPKMAETQEGHVFSLENYIEETSGDHKVLYYIDKNGKRHHNFQQLIREYNGIDYYGNPSGNLDLPITKFTYIKVISLLIAAPKEDFKLDDKKEIKNFKIIEKKIPDPVVFQPVKGGYLIITKWGPEAEDSILTNEIEN